ncbi:UxaA family hydrolase [Gayadomonas joobiniege]|uniref:UxaA family hydrolase n=1 Tax=Gayadomonas joobiniege TaxID=1234606 RepID=UPI00036B1860|nr:UxaA family hydrolase [Gayadomonas joobiniege]
MNKEPRLILLHPNDNVLVCSRSIKKGEPLTVEGHSVVADADMELGHKIARRAITASEKIIKYNAPIGSASKDIELGQHVHMHNLQSDYIASHTRDNKGGNGA